MWNKEEKEKLKLLFAQMVYVFLIVNSVSFLVHVILSVQNNKHTVYDLAILIIVAIITIIYSVRKLMDSKK